MAGIQRTKLVDPEVTEGSGSVISGTLQTQLNSEVAARVSGDNALAGQVSALAAKFPVRVIEGGTGATTADAARTNLGLNAPFAYLVGNGASITADGTYKSVFSAASQATSGIQTATLTSGDMYRILVSGTCTPANTTTTNQSFSIQVFSGAVSMGSYTTPTGLGTALRYWALKFDFGIGTAGFGTRLMEFNISTSAKRPDSANSYLESALCAVTGTGTIDVKCMMPNATGNAYSIHHVLIQKIRS